MSLQIPPHPYHMPQLLNQIKLKLIKKNLDVITNLCKLVHLPEDACYIR
jgi:hypothetical protein